MPAMAFVDVPPHVRSLACGCACVDLRTLRRYFDEPERVRPASVQRIERALVAIGHPELIRSPIPSEAR